MSQLRSNILRSKRGHEMTVICRGGPANRESAGHHASDGSSRGLAPGEACGTRAKRFGNWLRRLLRCETDDQCRSIQRGGLWGKRLGRWAMLFFVDVTLFVSNVIAAMIDQIQGYEAANTLFVDRWTAGPLVR